MVRNGIDCIEKYDALFQGKRLGLITSVSGVNRKLKSSIDILAERYEVRALFSPEHGVRGNVDAGGVVADAVDAYTGIPVYSLYRTDSKRLTKEMSGSKWTVLYMIFRILACGIILLSGPCIMPCSLVKSLEKS